MHRPQMQHTPTTQRLQQNRKDPATKARNAAKIPTLKHTNRSYTNNSFVMGPYELAYG